MIEWDDCDYCDYHKEYISIFGDWCFCELNCPQHDLIRDKKARHCQHTRYDTLEKRMEQPTRIPIL